MSHINIWEKRTKSHIKRIKRKFADKKKEAKRWKEDWEILMKSSEEKEIREAEERLLS
ncbi:MAG: hypothetical protein ISS41_03310 [Candidatus Aminicenantes bacterium]|nr:hypothetical protein [Candidatus Aminicenantes bacterium]